jgi:hypothetical protein
LDNHCLEKKFLNQRNSQRFNGTPNAYRWKYWLPCPTDCPIACLDKRFPREPTFRGIRSLIGSSYCASSSDAPAKTSGPKTRQCGFKRVLHRPVETAARSGPLALTLAEREEISRGVVASRSLRSIG